MEDDLEEKEDDRGSSLPSEPSIGEDHQQLGLEDNKEHPDYTFKDVQEDIPPPGSGDTIAPVMEENYLVHENTFKVGTRLKHRACTAAVKAKTIDGKENTTFASNKKVTGITINGRNLTDIQKERKTRSMKITLDVKTTPGRKTNKKKTTSSSDQEGQMWKYLVRN